MVAKRAAAKAAPTRSKKAAPKSPAEPVEPVEPVGSVAPVAVEPAADPGDWTALADALLQRAALLARVAWDRAPDPLAGLRVDDADLAALLASLPGLDTGDAAVVRDLEARLAPTLDAAFEDFFALLAAGAPQDTAIAGPSAGVHALCRVVRAADLDEVETAVLAVLAAIDLDPRRQRIVGYLNDDVTQRRATPFTLARLFGGVVPDLDAVNRAIGPGGGLQRAALVSTRGSEPWASTPVVLAPNVAWWLIGDRFFDPALPPGVEWLAGVDHDGGADLVTVAGRDRVRRLQAALLALRGSTFLVSPVPTVPEEWDAVVRQATLGGMGVVLEIDGELHPAARDRIERATHLAWGLVSVNELALTTVPRRPFVDASASLAAARVTTDEWASAFGSDTPHEHRLTAEQLHLVQRAAGAAGGDVTHAVRRLAAGHIDRLATRTRPARGLDDIVLDEHRTAQLHEVIARARHRETVFDTWGFRSDPSAGVVALFSGPSGTGKTLAAEIVAGALGLDLYQVDIAGLVSKYIGETEKNLSQVFDAAEASNVVLFFDEADAIIGKRSEVSDAHDRYANIEVAYLLQRMERFDGVVVLATNLPKNIDPAFVRRIHVAVEFPMPEAPEREQIWLRSFPPAAPLKDLDLGYFARQFELSGGAIRNAALTAAFLAADGDDVVTPELLLIAVQREFAKQGRLFDLGVPTPRPAAGSARRRP